jgi:hypothetical protein
MSAEASGDMLQLGLSQSFSQFTVIVVVVGGQGGHHTLPFGSDAMTISKDGPRRCDGHHRSAVLLNPFPRRPLTRTLLGLVLSYAPLFLSYAPLFRSLDAPSLTLDCHRLA